MEYREVNHRYVVNILNRNLHYLSHKEYENHPSNAKALVRDQRDYYPYKTTSEISYMYIYIYVYVVQQDTQYGLNV